MHPDRRRSKWVIRWKDQGTPVLAIVIRRLRRPCEDVVPSVAQSVFHLVSSLRGLRDVLENIRLGWVCDNVWRRILSDRFILAG